MPLPRPRFNRALGLLCRQDGSGELAERMAAAARLVLRASRLSRLRELVPHLFATIEVAADDPTSNPERKDRPSYADLRDAAYPAAFARASTLDGDVYGLPVWAQAHLLYFRNDLLAAIGVAPLKTWDEVVTVGRAMQAKGDIAGIAVDYGFQNLFF